MTHPMGSGFWGQAALSGQLCGSAWHAMTEACFQRVAAWWEVLTDLCHRKLIVDIRLVEADGVVMALQRMMGAAQWRLKVKMTELAILPDLAAVSGSADTVYTLHPAVADNIWRLQRDFEIPPLLAQWQAWPLPLRAVMDANVGLGWVLLVKPANQAVVLEALHQAQLPKAFQLGELHTGADGAGLASGSSGSSVTFIHRPAGSA
jgi:hypothetical protein